MTFLDGFYFGLGLWVVFILYTISKLIIQHFIMVFLDKVEPNWRIRKMMGL